MELLTEPLLPHGGYRNLRSYVIAEAVYDATVVFCRRFLAGDRRMADQMVQAARSQRRAQQAHQASGSAQGNSAASPAPACPRCGKPMVQRIEHDKALGRVMLGLLKDDTEWYEHCRSVKYGPRVMPRTRSVCARCDVLGES